MIALSACVGGDGGSPEVVVQPPAPEPEPLAYTPIGGPTGNAEIEGRDALRAAQEGLNELGLDAGPADGLMGPRTKSALETFQAQSDLPVTGTLTADTQGALQFEATRAVASDPTNALPNTDTNVAVTPTRPDAPTPPPTPSTAPTTSTSNNWISYLSGNDIRAACTASTPDTYRFVYNAKFTEHVRVYEMLDAGDGSALLDILVRGSTRIGSDPRQISSRIDGKRSLNGLAPFERRSLLETLTASGFNSNPVPSGTVLPSDAHFWVVSGCQSGQFTLNAWVYPSDRWDEITFPGMLGQLDFTNVMFNPVSVLTDSQRAAARTGDGPLQAFDLIIGNEALSLR